MDMRQHLEGFAKSYKCQKSHGYFALQTYVFIGLCMCSNICGGLSIYVLIKMKQLNAYRNVLLAQVILPLILANHFSFIFQPNQIVPYLVLFTSGIAHRPALLWWFFYIAAFVLASTFCLLVYSLIFNVILVHDITKPGIIDVLKRAKKLILPMSVVYLGMNMGFFWASFEWNQDQRNDEIATWDPETAQILRETAATFIQVENNIFMKIILVELWFGVPFVFSILVGLILLTIREIRSRRGVSSQNVYTSQLAVSKIIIVYVIIGFTCLCGPMLALITIPVLNIPSSSCSPILLMIYSPMVLMNVFMFINYVSFMKSFRKQLLDLNFCRRKPKPSVADIGQIQIK